MGFLADVATGHENTVIEPTAEANLAALSAAQQRDDARQQAEEDAAKAVLSQLSEEESAETEESGEAPAPQSVKSAKEIAAEKKADEEKRRAEHEAAEARRKAEWEEKKRLREETEQAAWETAVAMDDNEVMSASLKRVGDDTEKLTRRNMKQCVTETIQTKCLEDVVFARQVMHPRKNMVNCFRYISRKAWEYVQDELKVSGIQPGPEERAYGCDVPDDLCYQWAEEYFMDLDVKEDKEKDEEFVPKPYPAGCTPKSKKPDKKKPEPKKPDSTAKPAESAAEQSIHGQLSLLDLAMLGEKAG